MSNVVKYTSTRKRAIIKDMSSYAGKAIFLIRGSSVQLDSQYADKLIKMCQRLHNEEAVEVLDIAFVNMSRIGHRVRDSVWAEVGRHGSLLPLLVARSSK
jgi:light-regulated signal transduction histidine kinase (bacteriophytochrome)